jgi:hypothetical protein
MQDLIDDAAIDAFGCEPRQEDEDFRRIAEPEVLGREMIQVGFGNMVEEYPPQSKTAKQIDAEVAVGRI